MHLFGLVVKTVASNEAPVAICISGLARSFVVGRVRRNIWAHAIWPIVDAADVFLALDDDHSGRKYEPTRAEPDWATATANLLKPVYWARLRASDGLAESLRVCRSLVEAREATRGQRYAWIVRLRPDAVHRKALPPFDDWPKLKSDARLVWSTYIGGASCARSVPPPGGKGVCLDDNFALMTRNALDAYFGAWPARDCLAKCNECRLGCALRRAGVRVGSIGVDFKLERGRPRVRNASADVASTAPLDALAGAVIRDLDLESSDAQPSSSALVARFREARHRIREKAVVRFVVVEPCGPDGLAQVLYDHGGDARHDVDPVVHGLKAPLAHRRNSWLGCDPPPFAGVSSH